MSLPTYDRRVLISKALTEASAMSDSNKPLQDMEEGADDMTKYSKLFLQFLKKEVFQDRTSISVEEAVTLVAALMDLSVSLLSKFRNEPIDATKATEIGRDAFMQMVDRLGFNSGQMRKSTIYTYRFHCDFHSVDFPISAPRIAIFKRPELGGASSNAN